jgi:diguanylate cyclase (GGDEF)-like protein/PAS domain S-box-containing protein
MKRTGSKPHYVLGATSSRMRQMERREWWLWSFVILVTLLLTGGIASFAIPLLRADTDSFYWLQMQQSVRGLLGLVLLFDIYSVYQQFRIHSIRRQLMARDELFRVISENAADMIAVVDAEGKRIYNSPAYERILGYSTEELQTTSALDQVHPDDRARLKHAAEQARNSGQGERMEYRMRHKDGSWRILESTASVVWDASGKSTNLVIVNRDITDRKRAEEQLQHNAFHDALTDLPNRALFLDRLNRAFNRAKRHPEYKFAVLFVDIDDFKKFNDSLGHTAGDKLLIAIAKQLTGSLRRDDTVSRQPSEGGSSPVHNDSLARLGGDEFTILIEDIHDASDAIRVATRIQETLAANPLQTGEQEMFASASVGVALSTSPHNTAEDLLRDADLAMYRAKALGKARCEVFDTAMHASAVKRLSLETELRKAIEREEFRVHYQPIIRLADKKIAGFEALVRWERPNCGLVPPAEFIAVAEESGLIVPMNRWLRLEACQKMRMWQAEFPFDPPLTLSLNVTERELAHPGLVADINRALEQTGLQPSILQLEIVETVAMDEAGKPQGVLQRAKALGVRLSIDDFGTGYSSLSRLRHFPVDTLKIDRAFISRMDTDADNRAIVRTIVVLAHNLGLKVVAEGTETLEEVNELLALDCEYAQGYLFSRPGDEASVRQLLMSGYCGKRSSSRAAAAE